MSNGVSYLVYMYTLGVGRILIKSFIIVCFLNPMAWKDGWAHRTGENENEDNDKIKNRSKRRAPVLKTQIEAYFTLRHIYQANEFRALRVSVNFCLIQEKIILAAL